MNGILKYKDSQYIFMVKNNRLIVSRSVKEPNPDIPWNDLFKNTEGSTEIPPFLIGLDLTTNKIIKFYIDFLLKRSVHSYEFSFHSHLIYKNKSEEFDMVQIEDSILSEFHLSGEKMEKTFEYEDNAYRIKLDNTPDEFEFQIGNTQIVAELFSYFNIDFNKLRSYEMKTMINFNFKQTVDVSIVNKLINISNDFICYITNKNLPKISKIKLYNKKKLIGDYFINNTNTISNLIDESCIIPFSLIKNSLGNLFNDIANTKIYTNHIKEKSLDSKNLSYSEIIMLAAGFEWQFKYMDYPIQDDIDKNIKYKHEIDKFLENQLSVVTGKEKKYYKNIKTLIQTDLESIQLSKKIKYALEHHEDILKPFISFLYDINNLSYPKMHTISECVADTRNIVAHGNLSKELPENVVLDFRIIEFLYYAMTLKSIDISTNNIQLAIKKLFKINVKLNYGGV